MGCNSEVLWWCAVVESTDRVPWWSIVVEYRTTVVVRHVDACLRKTDKCVFNDRARGVWRGGAGCGAG